MSSLIPNEKCTATASTPDQDTNVAETSQDASAPESHDDTDVGTTATPALIEPTLPTHQPSSLRWWIAVGVGVLVSVPFAFLLSYGAFLMAFLGLFFFALFGIVIGAVMFRVAAPARPVNSASVLVGTTIVVLFCGMFSLIKEARDFPSDIGSKVVEDPRLDIGERTVDEYKAAVAAQVRGYVSQAYAPGGVLGYWKWVATDGTLTPEQLDLLRKRIVMPQKRYVWMARVTLSMALLGFGVSSQTFGLRRRKDEEKQPAPVV